MIKTIVVDDEPAALERYSAYVSDYGQGFSVAASPCLACSTGGRTSSCPSIFT